MRFFKLYMTFNLFINLAFSGHAQQAVLSYKNLKMPLDKFIGISGDLTSIVDPHTNDIYWTKTGKKTIELWKVPFSKTLNRADESRAIKIIDLGYGGINRMGTYNPISHSLLFNQDTTLTENYNLIEYDLTTKKLRTVSQIGKTFHAAFDIKRGAVVYVGQKTKSTDREMCVFESIFNKQSRKYNQNTLACGTIASISDWNQVVVDPNTGDIYFKGMNQKIAHLLKYSRKDQKISFFDAANTKATSVFPLGVYKNSLIYGRKLAGDLGVITAVNLESLKSLDLLKVKNVNEDSVGILDSESGLLIIDFTFENTINVLKLDQANTSVQIFKDKLPTSIDTWLSSSFSGYQSKFYFSGTKKITNDLSVPAIYEFDLEKAISKSNPLKLLFVPKAALDVYPSCKIQEVWYPTFDLVNGKPRMLKATVYEPKVKLQQQGAFIFAHGGPSYHHYDTSYAQALCHVGYWIMSPEYRGSAGFGQEFEDLNNFDWGGNDSIDIEYASLFLQKKLGLSQSRVGIFGHSYGAFLVEVLLSKKKPVFSAGIAISGFSNITYLIENGSIPDFDIREMGDPKIPKYRELQAKLSPYFKACEMNQNLLMIFGSNDIRTPSQDQRNYVRALRACSKIGKVSVFEAPNESHEINFYENSFKMHQMILDFAYKHIPL